MRLDVVPGTPGLDLKEIVHILIPGRGRDASGRGLNQGGLDRIAVAKVLYEQIGRRAGGRIVCSGYKSPADSKGTSWSPPEAPEETFVGIPEADLMKAELVRRGIPSSAVCVERHSIDTVTNFLRSELEGHFGDDRPVAVVAQAAHLDRMLDIIAPHSLRRRYLGVVVPEHTTGAESHLVRLVSRFVTFHLPREPAEAIATATRRATSAWRLARAVGKTSYH